MDNSCWEKTKTALKAQLGAATYKNWIEPLRLLDVRKDIARIAVDNNFIGDYVQRSFGTHLLRAFQNSNVAIQRLQFVTQIAAETTVIKAPKPAQPQHSSGQAGDEKILGAVLNPRFRFAHFVVGDANALAYTAVRRITESANVAFNPLFLHSAAGLGKTHLLHAIAWQIKTTKPSAKGLYLSAEQFMYSFVQALRNKNTHRFKALFRSIDILLIDDVQFILGKESTQEEFFHTFNALIDQEKQVVIAGDRPPADMDGMDERMKSRLQMGLIVDLQPADYTLRLDIVKSKAAEHIKTYPDVMLGDGVLQFMAQHIGANIRVLEGALNRLFAIGQMIKRPISVDMCRESMADLLRVADRKLSIDAIMRKTCQHYDVQMTDLISARRSRSIARPRQVAMFLCKQLTTKSLPEIGRSFGKRDHTTVIHAVKKIQDLRAHDEKIAKDLERLQRDLQN